MHLVSFLQLNANYQVQYESEPLISLEIGCVVTHYDQYYAEHSQVDLLVGVQPGQCIGRRCP